MTSDPLPLQLRTRYIAGLIENIQAYFQKETGIVYSKEVISQAVNIWLERRFDRILEDIGEVITSPQMSESQHFREILESQSRATVDAAEEQVSNVADVETESSVYTGYTQFAPAKLGAMIEYLSRNGQNIYKTTLNKLLFYSDFSFYFLHRRSISGATYINLPFGPVPQHVENVLNDLELAKRIQKSKVQGVGTNALLIKPGDPSANFEQSLTKEETETLDWVLRQYGSLSATEISAVSHKEKAYASTRRNEPIAYEYAKFFSVLPPKRQSEG